MDSHSCSDEEYARKIAAGDEISLVIICLMGDELFNPPVSKLVDNSRSCDAATGIVGDKGGKRGVIMDITVERGHKQQCEMWSWVGIVKGWTAWSRDYKNKKVVRRSVWIAMDNMQKRTCNEVTVKKLGLR